MRIFVCLQIIFPFYLKNVKKIRRPSEGALRGDVRRCQIRVARKWSCCPMSNGFRHPFLTA